MVEVFKRGEVHFRIVISDLKNKQSKTISLVNHSDKTLEDIRATIEKLFTKKG